MKLFIISLAVITILGIFISRMLGGKPNLIGKLLMGFVMSVAVSYFVNTNSIKSTIMTKNDLTLVDTLKKVTNFNVAPMQMLTEPVITMSTISKESASLANNFKWLLLKQTTANVHTTALIRSSPLHGYFNTS